MKMPRRKATQKSKKTDIKKSTANKTAVDFFILQILLTLPHPFFKFSDIKIRKTNTTFSAWKSQNKNKLAISIPSV